MTELVWQGNSKPLPPQWLAFPSIECGSIGWRMGSGETYGELLYQWMEGLTEEELDLYHQMFPPPISWTGTWNPDWEQASEEVDAITFAHNNFYTYIWRPNKDTKYTPSMFPREGNFQVRVFGPDSSFSPWFRSEFVYGGEDFWCAIQALVSDKASFMNDSKDLSAAKTPEEVIQIEQSISAVDENMWKTWEYTAMLNVTWNKFFQNRELRQELLDTGDSLLVVALPGDSHWGIGMDPENPSAKNPWEWKGENLMGFALMEVRDELLRVCRYQNVCDWNYDLRALYEGE